MRQAGFEPAHPEITRLKLVAFTARPLTLKHLKKYTAPSSKKLYYEQNKEKIKNSFLDIC